MVIAPSGVLYEVCVSGGGVVLLSTAPGGAGMDDVIHARNVGIALLGQPDDDVTAETGSERIAWDGKRNQLALRVLGSDGRLWVAYKAEDHDLVGWYPAQWSNQGVPADVMADLPGAGPPPSAITDDHIAAVAVGAVKAKL